jgi:hypothetical protein
MYFWTDGDEYGSPINSEHTSSGSSTCIWVKTAMNKVVKTLLIVITVIVSLQLLCVFVLYNFPYDALVNRIDTELRSFGITFSAGDVRYGFPLRFILHDLEVAQKKENVNVTAEDVGVRLRLFSFTKHKTLEIRGTGITVKSSHIDGSGGYFQIAAQFNPIGMLRSNPLHQFEAIIVQVGGMDVARVFFSGFELSDLKLKQVFIELGKAENGFAVKRGFLKSDVVESELTGKLDEKSLDVTASVSLTKAFYDRFKDLKGLVDSFFKNGKLRMHILGTWESPRVEFNK